MDNREVLGSASEVPARPPGSGYNFRSRSHSASTAPKNRRLGPVETRGAGYLLDLPSIIPRNFPTPRGAGNPQSDGNTEIPSPTLSTRNSTRVDSEASTLIPNRVSIGVETHNSTANRANSTLVRSYNSTLLPIHGIKDPLPVPQDAHDRPTLHDMSAKNDKNLAGKNNMAMTYDNDNSSKLSHANPLLGQVLVTRPTMSSDVTADNRPEQPLRSKAARDRFDGNASNMVVANVQNATLVAAKPVYLDTLDLDRTAQWIADSQSTASPPSPSRVRYASGSSSSESSLSPPVLTPHHLDSQPQPRRKPPSCR